MKIAFDSLPTQDVGLMRIIASPLHAPLHGLIRYEREGREDHDLFYLLSGGRRYRLEGREDICVQPGDIMLLPMGSCYTSEVTGCGPSEGLFVRFTLTDAMGNLLTFSDGPQCCVRDTEGVLLPYFQHLATLSLRTVGQLKAKACLAELIQEIIQLRLNQREESWLTAVTGYMGAHLQEPLCIKELAEKCHMSERTFCRRFKDALGVPPVTYHRRLRVQKAQELLVRGYFTLEDAAEALGFTDAPHLSRCIFQETGMHTEELRRARGGLKRREG